MRKQLLLVKLHSCLTVSLSKLCLSLCSLAGSAKSSLEAVMYREVRRMTETQSDSNLC